MLYVGSHRNMTLNSNVRVLEGSPGHKLLKEIALPTEGIKHELKKVGKKYTFVMGQLDKFTTKCCVNPFKVKYMGFESYPLKSRVKDLFSKMKKDWQNATKPKAILEPEHSDADVILRFLFGK